ncbi:transcription factor AP-1-like [Gouania willdenowi]|uniref:Transcription factor Jun n=1 Tax=Gouania willdenowi TaxID=441366 RepID=A0A8C5NAY3_GOUWI|nr:transcription factor AP-1 [Gouania willdenowi]XP_028328467.1 transcription factor AP-1-like [Gouania willdenowi]
MSKKMEATFYEEASNSQHDGTAMYGFNPKTLKQTMTLNLNDPKTFKPQLGAKQALDILTSPDVGLLKLASPELERLIIQSCTGLTTPTPSMCHRNITDEQEGFAEGFAKALAELHYGTAGIPFSCTTARTEPPEYTDLGSFNRAAGTVSQSATDRHPGPAPSYTAGPQASHHGHMEQQQQHPRLHALKEEPQTVPEMSGETPPLSPINMENQERIKAERKRMRNRVAASKCRKRKLERVSRLEDRVKALKNQNTELVSSANVLRDELALLKQKVMDHVNSGCQLILTQQLQAF